VIRSHSDPAVEKPRLLDDGRYIPVSESLKKLKLFPDTLPYGAKNPPLVTIVPTPVILM
jgi:hypothetical protein